MIYALCYIVVYSAVINVTKVTVHISPLDDDVILVVLDLQVFEPTDFYQVTIVTISDPNVVVGEKNTFNIINDDDYGK